MYPISFKVHTLCSCSFIQHFYHHPPARTGRVFPFSFTKIRKWECTCTCSSLRKEKKFKAFTLQEAFHQEDRTQRDCCIPHYNGLRLPCLWKCMHSVMIKPSLPSLVLIMQHFLSKTTFLILFSMPSLYTLAMKRAHICKAKGHRVDVHDLLIVAYVWLLFCHGAAPKVLTGCNLSCLTWMWLSCVAAIFEACTLPMILPIIQCMILTMILLMKESKILPRILCMIPLTIFPMILPGILPMFLPSILYLILHECWPHQEILRLEWSLFYMDILIFCVERQWQT